MHEGFIGLNVICVVGMVLGQGIDYETTPFNVCTDTFEIQSSTMIQCVFYCIFSQECLGVLAVSGNTCRGCSAVEVPDNPHVAGSFYRSTDDTFLALDLVQHVNDSQITASSTFCSVCYPSRGRLHTPDHGGADTRGAWLAESRTPYAEYIQVQFDDLKQVFEIGTQGRSVSAIQQWVTSYQVSFSVDCITFSIIKDSANVSMIFPGNSDQNTVVWNALPGPVFAVCVRITPITFSSYIAMRFGVKGRDSFP